MKKYMKKGFTLIELLVVIAIIGILAALIIVSLSGARSKASDTQRKNNARNLDTALAQYYQDNNSAYPSTNATFAAGGIDIGTNTACTAPLSNLVGVSAYLTTNIACGDPASTPLTHRYFTEALAGTKYTIAWSLASQTENTASSGNGVYQAAEGGILTIPGTNPNIPNTITTLAAFGTNKVFSVYGPQ